MTCLLYIQMLGLGTKKKTTPCGVAFWLADLLERCRGESESLSVRGNVVNVLNREGSFFHLLVGQSNCRLRSHQLGCTLGREIGLDFREPLCVAGLSVFHVGHFGLGCALFHEENEIMLALVFKYLIFIPLQHLPPFARLRCESYGVSRFFFRSSRYCCPIIVIKVCALNYHEFLHVVKSRFLGKAAVSSVGDCCPLTTNDSLNKVKHADYEGRENSVAIHTQVLNFKCCHHF